MRKIDKFLTAMSFLNLLRNAAQLPVPVNAGRPVEKISHAGREVPDTVGNAMLSPCII
jgi:hypothetical protein